MYQFDSHIRYSEVDASCELTLHGLMNYFQDCSCFHSESLEVGVSYLAKEHLAWVLISWQICVERMPKLAELVTVQTWAYEMKVFYGYRNFTMNAQDGTRLAYANSVWALVDTRTGHPVKLPQFLIDTYGKEAPLDMDCSNRKIVVPKEMISCKELVVPAHFIDSNQHMNNEKYVMVAKDCLPGDFQIGELRVEYRKEAKLGDKIYLAKAENEAGVTVTLNDENGKAYAIVVFMHKQ